MMLISTIAADLDIDESKKKIDVRYVVVENNPPMVIRNDNDVRIYIELKKIFTSFVMYPLFITTAGKSTEEKETGDVVCAERTESNALALAAVESNNEYSFFEDEDIVVSKRVLDKFRDKVDQDLPDSQLTLPDEFLPSRNACIYVYDSLSAAGHDVVVLVEIEKLVEVIPICLLTCKFYENKGIDIDNHPNYKLNDKMDLFGISVVENVPQQPSGNLDCGLYMATYAECLTFDEGVPSVDFDTRSYSHKICFIVVGLWSFRDRLYFGQNCILQYFLRLGAAQPSLDNGLGTTQPNLGDGICTAQPSLGDGQCTTQPSLGDR
ncbi:hypothetical protein FXO37_33216 [Capsicum annuum]|nr:hypothetical protein FXO37_33216 [Capsicum annuum]